MMINFVQKKINPSIFIALSGGVDSAVSALQLKPYGKVQGIFMRNWEDQEATCSADQDLSDVRTLCAQLDMSLTTVNFAKAYWDTVFQHCLDEFAQGRTPNPDIGCNREIKFKALLEYAIAQGADYLATGHYARIAFQENQYYLLKGLDASKDQSYFLYTLNQAQLAKIIFPLGHQQKKEIRQIAQKSGLINANKKDSTGICFIGERRFKHFLSEFLLAQPGNIETVDGKTIGKHDGIMYYTLGQRQGLNIGGKKGYAENPWYVVKKDVPRNVLVVAQGHDHPLLFSKQLIAKELHWVSGHSPTHSFSCTAKTRYRQQDQNCVVKPAANQTYEVTFENSQRAITPGQSVVFYLQDQCLGGGIIL